MTDFTKISEDELVGYLKQNNLSAFEEIYKRYWKRLYGAAYKRLRNKEVCEEIVQELFTNLWVNRQILLIKTGIASYLYASITHLVIDNYRKEMVREKYRDTFRIIHKYTDNSTEETVLLKDLSNTIEIEISHLSDRCRCVYELSRKEHKSNKEIAMCLGISEKTVENHLTRALSKLRMGLNNYLIMAIIMWLFK